MNKRTMMTALLVLVGSTLSAGLAAAQVWETAADHPGDDRYYTPNYPVVFVAARVVEDTSGNNIVGKYHIGTDVLSANNPDRDNHLWVALPNGNIEKLFPLPEHQLAPGLIDTPLGQLTKGTVVEPNVSEDGRRIYFSYFHDVTLEQSHSFGLHRLPLKGADLYWIDLSPLIADPGVDPSTLAVQRLTTRVYAGNGSQSDSDRNKDAMNQTLAEQTGPNDWGTVYMHPVEMRTEHGLVLLYASDERRVRNSNQSMSIGYANHNFNLHMADIRPDGTLANARQWQYYTTTSALSPTPLRDGVAFSYQASTADARNWQIQGIDSAGRWYPILGYGINPELFHLGALCVDSTGPSPTDYFVATRYYNINNEGFGALWAQDLAQVGQNTYDKSTYWGLLPRQVGSYKLTSGVNSNDYPAAKVNGAYVGKVTTPRCGRPNELYMAYSPTSANGRLNDADGNRNIYHSYIAFRPNLDAFHPHDPVDVAQGTGLRIVVDDVSDAYTLVWPVPVLSWYERTGDVQQASAGSVVDPDTPIKPGLPHAQVGTSALYNTDRRPFDCWLGSGGQTPYSPNKGHTNINQENDLIVNNTDGLTYVQNQSDFCEPLDPQTVLGVAVNLTSNKTNMSAGFNPGYRTDGSGKKEAAKLLGVYDVRNQADQSFMATIPAHEPFEFHLLDRQYGLKLLDVRSWHSLQPRETRNNCGGCHQHEPGAAIEFAGTVADTQPALDMVKQTPFVTYDRYCQPVMRTSRRPTRRTPEWNRDIWAGFEQHCGGCHNSTASTDQAALAAFGYGGEEGAYNQLKNRNYADAKLGALGSPAFWAARGERTDGRNNNLAKYQPDYSDGDWGFHFAAVHASSPGLCSTGDLRSARWVYRFGLWIDNHMPRDTGSAYGYGHDWFHPTVDVALSTANCAPTRVRVGVWDDIGGVEELTTELDGQTIDVRTYQRNGGVLIDLPSAPQDALLTVTARDLSDNRQIYRKSLGQLVAECAPSGPTVTATPIAGPIRKLRNVSVGSGRVGRR